MKKIVRKSVTWLLIFGMVFTPLMTSIDLVSANAEEGATTISIPRDNLSTENAKRAANAEEAQKAGNDAAAAATAATTAAENAAAAATNAQTALSDVQSLLTDSVATDTQLIDDANGAVDDANDAIADINGLIDAANNAILAVGDAKDDLDDALADMDTAKGNAQTAKNTADRAIDTAKDSKNTVNKKAGNAETAKSNMDTAIANANDTTDVDAKVQQAIADMNTAEQSISDAVEAIKDASVAVGVAKEALKDAINDKNDAIEAIADADAAKTELENSVKTAEDTANAAVIAIEKVVDEALADETEFGAKPMDASAAAVAAAEEAKGITENLESLAEKSANKAGEIATIANERLNEGAGREELEGYVDSANAAAKKAAEYAAAAQKSAEEANKAKDKAEEIYRYLKGLYDEQLAAIDDVEKKYKDALDNINADVEAANAKEVKDANDAIAKADKSIGTATDKINDAQGKLADAVTATGKAGADKATADTSVADAETAVGTQNSLIKTANGKIDGFNGAVDALNSAIDESNGLVDDANDAIDDAEAAIETENSEIKDYNKVVEAYNEALEDANDAIDALDYEEAEQKIADAKQALTDAKEALAKANSDYTNAVAKVQEAKGYAEDADTEAQNAADQAIITEAAAKTTKNDLAEGKFGKDYDTFVREANEAGEALQKAHENNDQKLSDNQALLDGTEGKPGLTQQKKELDERIKANQDMIDDADYDPWGILGESDREKAERLKKHGVGKSGLFDYKVTQNEYDWAVKYLADLAAAEEQLAKDNAAKPGIDKAYNDATKAVQDATKAIKDADDKNTEKQQALKDADKYVDGFKLTAENTLVIDQKTQELLSEYAELTEVNDDTNVYEDCVGFDWPWEADKEQEIEKKYSRKWYQFSWLSDETIYDNLVTIVNNEAVIVCEDMEQLAAMKASMADAIAKAKAAAAATAKTNAETAAQNAQTALDNYKTARANLEALTLKTEADINEINKENAPTVADKYDLAADSKIEMDLDETKYDDVEKTSVKKEEKVSEDKKLKSYDDAALNTEKDGEYKEAKGINLEVPSLGIDLDNEEIIKALTKLGITVDDIKKFESNIDFPELEDLLEKVNAAEANWREAEQLAFDAEEAAKEAKKDAEKAKKQADAAKHALDTYDEYVRGGEEGGYIPTVGETEGISFVLPTAGAASGVAGVRRNLVASTSDEGEVVADTTGEKVEEPTIIEEEELPAAKEPAKKTTTIEENELPAAPAPEGATFPWWILIVVAALTLGFGGYKFYEKKKNENKVA